MPISFVRILCGLALVCVVASAVSARGVWRGPHPDSFGTAYSATLWPKTASGVADVFYTIDSASDPNATPKIQAAIKQFNSDFTGLIQWVPWTSAQTQGPNYVDINLSASNPSGQCEALEGYEAVAAQQMGGSTACTEGTILHEMGHIVGLWHEMVRPDASTYVTVSYANVIKGSWGNFQPPTDNYQTLGLYDYASLMEYPSGSLTRNGAPVIESKPAGIPLGSSDGVPYKTSADYSAADKEAIKRLYGAAPESVTVTSNPAGLSVLVDGAAITTPHTYSWALNSTHTLAVASGVQTLKGDIYASKTSATFYYTYGRWNDSTAQSHSITVSPGNGDLPFSVHAPAVATYTANFVQLVPYSAVVSPAGAGSVSVMPAPQTYSGIAGSFFVARQLVTLTATPSTGWSFYEFDNAPYSLPGGLGANPKTFYVPDTGNPVAVTAKFTNEPVYTVDVTPDAATSNLHAYVDGTFWYTPKNFSPMYDTKWTANSTHTLYIDSPERPYSINARFVFTQWNQAALARTVSAPSRRTRALSVIRRTALPLMRRNGSSTSSVTLSGSSTAYTATLSPQFAPATNFGYPPCGGSATLSPASPTGDGFYPSGQQLTFAESPSKGWKFAGWAYDVTGTTSSASLSANDETLVFAQFNTVATPLTITSLSPATATAGAKAFTLTLNGTGFATNSLVVFNGTYRTVTYVNSKKLEIPLVASDVATAGAYQVEVENFPTGWTGCAVFAYTPFLVAAKP
jgi:hypothetical protein